MRTEARTSPRGIALALAVVALVALGPVAARAQLVRVDSDTEVRALRFTFTDHQTFSTDRLLDRMALRAPGAFDFLPFIGADAHPFSPLELQRDVARIRRYYQRSGFPDATIDYEIAHDGADNRVSVTFLVTEGDPTLRGDLVVRDARGTDIDALLPEELRAPWRAYVDVVVPFRGERVGELERAAIEDQITSWLGDNGYPFANTRFDSSSVSSRPSVEGGDLVLLVDTGDRSRVGDVTVEGAASVDDGVIVRELPFARGDWYSAARLSEGERELFGLDLVRIALARPTAASADSTVDVDVRVTENLLRVISGQLGYATESGLSGQTDWTHRNILGGAQTLTVSLQARTGALGIGTDIERRYAASVSLKQPYFFGRRTSLLLTPHTEYRDDFRDRSVLFGGDALVVRQWGGLRAASVSVALTRRHVFDFRPTGAEGFDYRILLAALDSLDRDVRLATLGGSLSWGRVDNPIAPRAGHLFRTSVEVTGPPRTSSAQYARLDASYARFVPFTARTGLAVRVAAGRLFPFGRSVPATDADKTLALVRLRDALFTAGGRYDVRGWGEQQLGPKFPDVRLQSTEPDTVLVAERYIPLGGLARTTGSIELRLPLFAARPRHASHLFLDAGRVWSPDDRFRVEEAGESHLRWSVGTGVELGTPIGPVRVGVGYKLNPSPYDLRDPQAVLDALLAGSSPLTVPRDRSRRWHVHLAIGTSY